MPAGDASELELVLKVLSRTRRMERSDKKLTSFALVTRKLGIEPEELVDDVELEDN